MSLSCQTSEGLMLISFCSCFLIQYIKIVFMVSHGRKASSFWRNMLEKQNTVQGLSALLTDTSALHVTH